MCISEEKIKEIIQEMLFNPKDDGESRLSVEINKHFDQKLDKVVSKLTMRFGIALTGFVFLAGGAWYTHSSQIAQNTEKIQEGGRYTQEEHNAYAIYVESRFLNIDNDLEEIKGDVKDIRKAVVK
jgi:hypothetical protein